MSDLALENILTQDSLKSIPTNTIIVGTPKAWWNFDQVTPAIRDSFNISSAVDSGTGRSTITYTNAMVDANYAFPLGGGNGGAAASVTILSAQNNDPTVTTISLLSANNAGSNSDRYYHTGSVLGELA